MYFSIYTFLSRKWNVTADVGTGYSGRNEPMNVSNVWTRTDCVTGRPVDPWARKCPDYLVVLVGHPGHPRTKTNCPHLPLANIGRNFRTEKMSKIFLQIKKTRFIWILRSLLSENMSWAILWPIIRFIWLCITWWQMNQVIFHI